MADYILVSLAGDQADAPSRSGALADLARRHGWTHTALNDRTWLATSGPTPFSIRRIGAWTMVGDLLNRHHPRLPPERPGDPWTYERKMLARFWGRYIGIRFAGRDRPDALLRDPSGALDCVAWEQDGLLLACGRAPDWLVAALRPDWRINVRRLGAALRDPLAAVGDLLLDGPVALTPGTLQPLPLSEPAVTLWSPADIARRSLGPTPSPGEAKDRLRAAIDEAVTGFAGLPGSLAAEVSGGLDSALVAASLTRSALAPVKAWLNAFGSTPESDERVQARAVGEALGFTPRHIPHAVQRLDVATLVERAAGFRPNVAILDTAHDLNWAAQVRRAGAKALMTGKGGDSILVQAPSADVFVDLWRAAGWRALRSADMVELAAANEISVWSMVKAARRHRLHGHRSPGWDHPILTPLPEPARPHPWLRDLDAFGPAKANQIAGVADSVSHNSPNALTETVDARHPLGAQPVVEACLALPTWLLALGGRDRGLAREAFRDRLTPAVLDRRSKGDMTRIYSRMIVDNLDVIRPWLIEGRLAALGLIDPVAADAELTPETLIGPGRYPPLLAAIVLEAWVRAWERQLGPTAGP